MVGPGETLVDLVAQDGGGGPGLRDAIGRHLAVETGRQQAAGGAVFQPVQHLAHDAKARRHQARGVARMDALGEDLDLEHAAGHAAQAGGEPELVVVAGAAVQADHQAHVAQARAQGIHIGQQVGRAAFFAGFDQTHDARVRRALRLERLDGGDAGVDRVAVVGAAATIELALHDLGRPGAEVAAPAGELGLFVQVAIHQHGLARGWLRGVARHARRRGAVFACAGRHFKEQHRRARHPVGVVQAHDLQREALDLLRAHPVGRAVQHAVEQAMRGPVGIEGGRLGRHLDVAHQLGHDAARPGRVDMRLQGGRVQRGQGMGQTSAHVIGLQVRAAWPRPAQRRRSRNGGGADAGRATVQEV